MHTKTVLVIDDEEAIRETLQMTLELEGYEVHTAEHGRAALEALEGTLRPNVILVDLMMPIMNGWEFIAAVMQDCRLSTIPILVLTAFPERAGALPARSVLSKPISLDALLAVVHHHCG
ncbi:response regulator [Sorangium sp. So ce233]|uniref:response regulator n=1 Tax=Sorangium sp. So ce233 TaxID=3133290 RepID=UPI003F5E351B